MAASIRAKWRAQKEYNFQKTLDKQEERRKAQEVAKTKVCEVRKRLWEENARRQSQETARRATYPWRKGETPPKADAETKRYGPEMKMDKKRRLKAEAQGIEIGDRVRCRSNKETYWREGKVTCMSPLQVDHRSCDEVAPIASGASSSCVEVDVQEWGWTIVAAE